MTFRQAVTEAHKRCGFTDDEAKAANTFADFNAPNTFVDQELQLAAGATEEDLINVLVTQFRRLQALSGKEQQDFLNALDEAQRRNAENN